MLKAAALALALLACSACAGVTSTSGIYATLAEARDAGAMARGWVPEGLPPGTTDLRVGHVESGTHWGLFVFPPAQAAPLHAIASAEITGAVPPCEPPSRFEWWPRLLRSPMEISRLHATGLRVYSGRDGRTYAINWNQGKAYYWK